MSLIQLDLGKPTKHTTGSLEALLEAQQAARRPSVRLAIRVKSRILLIDSGDVTAVVAQGNYVLFRRTETSHLLRESISVVAAKLARYGFLRVHRSVLVNAALVEEIEPRQSGEYGLRMIDGSEYTVTRTYKNNLNALAESWIGIAGLLSRSRVS